MRTCHWQCVFFPPFVLKNHYLSGKKKCLLQAMKDNPSATQPYLQESNHNWDPGKHSWHYEKTDVVLGRNFRCFLWGRCTDKSAWEIRTKVCDPARRFKRQEDCTEPETKVLRLQKDRRWISSLLFKLKQYWQQNPSPHFRDACHTSPQV